MSIKSPPKVWTSFAQQLVLLQQRGMHIADEERALSYLERIGYYRLSGFWYSFRECLPDGTCGDRFVDGCQFEDILSLYLFDKKLRLLALDALERIEVAVRVDITYLLGRQYGAMAHYDVQNFQKAFKHRAWLNKYEDCLQRESQSTFVKHHLDKYDGMPIWAGCEVWDFGALSKLFSGMKRADQDAIAVHKYKLPSGRHLASHLRNLNFIRNVSAHHGRLWNRHVVGRATLSGMREPIRKDEKYWTYLDSNQVFASFCLMRRMLKILSPHSQWGERFVQLLAEFPQLDYLLPNVTLAQFGISQNFGNCPEQDIQKWGLWKPRK